MTDLPSVADVIKELRGELAEATADGEGQDIRFDMGDIQIELEAVVTKDAKGELNLKVFGVGFDGGGGVSGASTVKLTLNLKPTQQDSDGEWGDVRTSRPLVTK